MEKIDGILKRFQTISLDELNRLKLMNRLDTKFTFALHQLPMVLEQLISNYKLLAIGGRSDLFYKTTYYDTANFDMYLKHHNGVLNRYKVRKRTYLENNTTYLEIKSKNNKGHTVKERIPHTENGNAWSDAENKFIASKLPLNLQTLLAIVSVGYRRLSLINAEFNEKITIDLDLEFSKGENKHKLNNIVVLEVKQTNRIKTPIFSILKEFKVRPTAFSKYCTGVNYLYPQLKKNNFKEKLVTLNKIINDGPTNLITSI
ncbi:MAG: polyphosphate polymerase domain-containing protein [Bacteroidia bacterium]